jgi:hypothetical protein
MTNYYYTDASGQKQGLVTEEQLRELAARGSINPHTPMESDTGYQGVAGQIPGLVFNNPPPNPFTAAPPAPATVGVPPSVAAPAKKTMSLLKMAGIGVIVLILISGVFVWFDKDNGLQRAASNGHLGTVKFFVSIGADINSSGSAGLTPLHQAAWYRGGVETVDFLVSNGADVNARTHHGSTPLHLAVTSFGNEIEVAKFLVSKGADIYAKDNDGNTPLDIAREKNPELAEYLISVQSSGSTSPSSLANPRPPRPWAGSSRNDMNNPNYNGQAAKEWQEQFNNPALRTNNPVLRTQDQVRAPFEAP